VSARRLLDDVELILLDGNNMLHRAYGSVDDTAQRSLLAQLRQAFPAPIKAILVLDGHPAPGSPPRQRISGSLEVRHAGSSNADDAIMQLLTARPYAARARTVMVSDDRSLTERARSAGGRTQRLGWLQALIAQPPGRAGGAIGRAGRPPRPPEQPTADEEREAWRPGRGATRKRGNPKRGRSDGRSDGRTHD